MAINRFWGQAPVAEYSPMSFQELAYAPQIMYQREQELQAGVDAMNEAKASLQSMLGDKAGKTEQFDSQYSQILDKISKEGATQRNLDAAKQLKQMYIKEVLPIEDYAKQREAKAAEYYKQSLDADNIILGPNPLEVKFDEYRKNPQSMQFQVARRSDLMKHGVAIGSQWARSNIKETPDAYGRVARQMGFKTAEEAMGAYNTDPNFKQWVDEQATLATKGAGLVAPNQDALDAIKSGIMTSVVGGVDYDRNYAFDAISQAQPTNITPPLVEVTPGATSSRENKDIELQLMMKDPNVKSQTDAITLGATSGAFKSIDELDNAISAIESGAEPSSYAKMLGIMPIVGGGAASTALGALSGAGDVASRFAPTPSGAAAANIHDIVSELKKRKSMIQQSVFNNLDLNKESIITLNRTNAGLYLDPKTKTKISDAEEGMSDDIETFLSSYSGRDAAIYGGMTDQDRKAVREYLKSDDKDKRLIVKAIRSQFDPGTETGTGQPTIVFDMAYKGKDEKTPTEVQMRLPRNLTDKAFTIANMMSQTNPYTQEVMRRFTGAKDYFYGNIEK